MKKRLNANIDDITDFSKEVKVKKIFSNHTNAVEVLDSNGTPANSSHSIAGKVKSKGKKVELKLITKVPEVNNEDDFLLVDKEKEVKVEKKEEEEGWSIV